MTPASYTVVPVGGTARLRVEAEGTAPVMYRWMKAGAPLSNGGRVSGADGPELTITDLDLSDTSSYSVWVSDACGAMTSPAVALIADCIANCDRSTASPVLNVNDFVCYQAQFANGSTSANCDGSTAPPVLNVNDFVCFMTVYAGGCR
jgi:hypothetical protein